MSSHSNKLTRLAGFARGALIAARFLLGITAILAGYLAWTSFRGGGVAGCGPGSGCDDVLASRWGYWFGLPISLLALPLYVGLLYLTWQYRAGSKGTASRTKPYLLAGSLLIIAAAAWFIAVQAFILGHFCPYCLTAHGLGVVAAGLLIAAVSGAEKAPPDRKGRVFASAPPLGRQLFKPGFAALSATAILVGGQCLTTRKGFAVQRLAPSASAKVDSEQHRFLSLYDGQFKLDLNELPMRGSPSAPHVIVSLFDYTCHHCRIMHGHLLKALHAFSNQVAIVSLPMPLDSHCNYLVKRTAPPQIDGCKLAHIGLAVWRARPTAMHTFDDWLFAPPVHPSVEAARQYAIKLVGAEAFKRAFADPWIDRQIKMDVDIFAANYRETHQGRMPQLIIGGRITIGEFSRAQDLFKVLEQEFHLPAPASAHP